MKNRKILAALLGLVLVAALLLCVYLTGRPQPGEGEKTFTVEVVHSDGGLKTFEYSSSEEYLGKVLLEQGLIQGEEGEYGLYILVVDGESAVYETDGAYWALYIDGEYAVTGADQTPVADGACYRLEYSRG